MVKFIISAILIGLGVTLSASYFHAEANPLITYDGKTEEQFKAEGYTLRYSDGTYWAWKPNSSSTYGYQKQIDWNKALFIKDLVIGTSLILVLCGVLFLFDRKLGKT